MGFYKNKIINLIFTALFVFSLLVLCFNFLFASTIKQDKQVYLHYLMGAIFDRQDNVEGAIDEYRKAIKFDPESSDIHLNLAADYIKLDNLDLAVVELEKAVELSSDNLDSRFLLALVYSSLKKDDLAAEQYEFILSKQLEEEPDNIDIIVSLAKLYHQQKKISERSEEHTSELQSHSFISYAVFCLKKKNKNKYIKKKKK